MKINLPTDTDGYLSQECQSCGLRFKVFFGEDSESPISYCPYCGYNGQDCWYTQPQEKYMQEIAVSETFGPELKKLERQLKGMPKDFFKISMKSDLTKLGPPPMETDEPLDMLHFPCCNETIKVTRHNHHFCIICGKEVDMTVSDSTKVFLSHKGIDKKKVIDFKELLKLLGYDPWLDDDDMPAGTQLERGLLQGMQDSCGVVFFITPSFKDEGYLATEINHAKQEKQKKNDKFAIVTLQFVDAEGNMGDIPKLLEDYVWKKPKTLLEAMREIVRALPVVPGIVDWREEIAGVVTAPKTRSTPIEISEEAKSILFAAVASDGRVAHTQNSGGHQIEAGGKSLLPDRDHQTIALWVGGFEDLQRKRYIKDIGNKGVVFEVTREGYKASDELSDD